MKKKIGVGIIGCGRVAGHHARSIEKLDEDFELCAICDINDNRSEELNSTLKNSVPAYDNYHHMLKENPEIEVVSIVTPSGMHFEHAADVMERYGRHVVIEKPMIMRPEQGDKLKEIAGANGLLIFPVFQYRFNKAVQRVKRAVDHGELGQIFMATIRTRWCRPQGYYDRDPWRGTFSHDGGATTNQGIHHLDILRHVMGEIRRVQAFMSTNGADIEVEDTTVAIVEFASGASGVIEITTAARPDDFESSLSFLGDAGIAVIGGWATNDLITFSPDPTQQELSSEVFPDVYGFGHLKVYEGVRDSIRNGNPAPVSFEDAEQTIRLLHGIYASDEQNNWVDVGSQTISARLGVPDEEISNLYRTTIN